MSGTVDNDLRFTGSGKIVTATSGNPRVEVGSTNPTEIRFLNSSNATMGQLEVDVALKMYYYLLLVQALTLQ